MNDIRDILPHSKKDVKLDAAKGPHTYEARYLSMIDD